MSRKTRREKILSQLHRQSRLMDGQEKNVSTEPAKDLTLKSNQTEPAQFSLSQINPFEKKTNQVLNSIPGPIKTQNATSIINYHYLVSDLRRIALLTGLAFLLELAIYFFTK